MRGLNHLHDPASRLDAANTPHGYFSATLMHTPTLTLRAQAALAAGTGARRASRITGWGAGSSIGGRVAMAIDPTVLRQLGAGRRTVLVTGTNGKTTTTRMVAAALGTLGPVATNTEGANMAGGLVTALAAARDAERAVLEVDELHLPAIADALQPEVIVLLNLSRDQLDRVGEIQHVETALRAALARHPRAVVVANCDDVLATSAACDSPGVQWVAAGRGWISDSVSCPRSGELIVHEPGHWYASGATLARPRPHWWLDADSVHGPAGWSAPLQLALPGTVNRGNAAHAISAAVAMGVAPLAAAQAVSQVAEVAGRYRTVRIGEHTARILLAKNPAGWQQALAMLNPQATGHVIAINGREADGQDLSWLWDVDFEQFGRRPVLACGERRTDLAVRLAYAGVPHACGNDIVDAIQSCPKGPVEVMVNYSAFLQVNRALRRMHA